MTDKTDQPYGYRGSIPSRSGCGYNCYCDNCCGREKEKRESSPEWRSRQRHREEMNRIMKGWK